MRSIRLMAVSTIILAGAWACGDGGGVGPNTPPVASFTAPTCTVNTACSFTSTSTDADGSVATTAWEFGDGNTAAGATVTNTFATVGTFQVKLTVTDNAGATGTVTNPVTVGTTGNLPPTASFTLPTGCTAGTPCGFHSTSTDADGTIAATNWDFGDQVTGEGTDVTHTYAVAGTYTVTLAVTDDDGAQGTSVQPLTVSPASSQDHCTTSGTVVDCLLTITQRSKVTFTITMPPSCELVGNTLSITAPRTQTVFFHMCNRQLGDQYVAKDAAGAPLVFEAGTQLALRFTQGTANPGNPPLGDPGIIVEGSFPTWTLKIDDGGAATDLDFNDVIVSVQATTP